MLHTRWMMLVVSAALALMSDRAAGQEPVAPLPRQYETPLDSLIIEALAESPVTLAARHRVDGARAAVGPAGSLDDPMLMLGWMNQPIAGAMTEEMAMRVLGVSQMIPFPGKRSLGRVAAEHELAAAEAELDVGRRAVIEAVREAYYEIAFLERAIEVVGDNERLLGDFIQITEARYGLGTGGQDELLEARVELAGLAGEAVMLQEERLAMLARLNSALDRPSDAPIPPAVIPARIALAAVAPSRDGIRFTSAALGARVAGSPLPALTLLQEQAMRDNPELRAQDAMIAAEAVRLELARKAHLPDLEVSLQYGQRNDLSDLVSAVVSLPIPVRRASRQSLEVREAEAMLAALEADRRANANAVRAEVAEAYANAERARSQLALFVASILPQGRAALESAMSGFQVGRVDFMTLLENQATLYGFETAYHRALTDFAIALAKLERLVGKEIL